MAVELLPAVRLLVGDRTQISKQDHQLSPQRSWKATTVLESAPFAGSEFTSVRWARRAVVSGLPVSQKHLDPP